MDQEIEPGREGSARKFVSARSDQAGFRRHVQPFSYWIRPITVYLEQVRFEAYRAEDGFDVIARWFLHRCRQGAMMKRQSDRHVPGAVPLQQVAAGVPAGNGGGGKRNRRRETADR